MKPARARPCAVFGTSCLAFPREPTTISSSKRASFAFTPFWKAPVAMFLNASGARGSEGNACGPAMTRPVVSDETLRAFMGGLSEEQFKQLFGLDHQLLDEGGRLIAQGKGHLGEALFAAGAGLAGLRRLRKQLDEKKDAIYKARGQAQFAAVQLAGSRSFGTRFKAIPGRRDLCRQGRGVSRLGICRA